MNTDEYQNPKLGGNLSVYNNLPIIINLKYGNVNLTKIL